MSVLRRIELLCDEADFDVIQKEIAHRQARSRLIDSTGSTILPDGDSNLAGAIVAEMVRDLEEYRSWFETSRKGA